MSVGSGKRVRCGQIKKRSNPRMRRIYGALDFYRENGGSQEVGDDFSRRTLYPALDDRSKEKPGGLLRRAHDQQAIA
ncbi:MAG: hypothetical protein GY788_10230 [bacterium]|nr:hypothetical protein [bacterium]